MNCNVRYNTKQHLIKKGMVDENMTVTSAMFFNENNRLSNLARTKYGVENQGKLYTTVNVTEKKVKAVENKEFFDELQEKHSKYKPNRNETKYQLVSDQLNKQASEKTLRDIADRMAIRIGIPVTFVNDPSDKFKGRIDYRPTNYSEFTGSNESEQFATINLAYATLDTPIHEILGHPLIKAIKNPISQTRSARDQDEFDRLIDEGYVDTRTADEDGNPILTNSNSKKTSQLYNNLLKELEYGRGKEVFDRVAKDYGVYRSRLNESSYENNNIIVGGKIVARNVSKKGKFFSYTDMRGNRIDTEFTQVTPLINSFRTRTAPVLENLEAVQEEAIVELLGLYTADRLDAIKDGKLISLLKRLLNEMKEMVRKLLGLKELYVKDLPQNLTIGDIADLLAYSNNKIILPESEIIYTTPDGNTFNTYGAANQHLAKLAREFQEIDLSNINYEDLFTMTPEEQRMLENKRGLLEDHIKHKYSEKYKNEKQRAINELTEEKEAILSSAPKLTEQEFYIERSDAVAYGLGDFDYVRVQSTYSRPEDHFDILPENYQGFYIFGYNTARDKPDRKIVTLSFEQADELFQKADLADRMPFNDRQRFYQVNDELNNWINDSAINRMIRTLEKEIKDLELGGGSVGRFVKRNEPYQQGKVVIEEWKQVNGIVYNPEEVYSRGQEFVSVIGAYSDFDQNLLLQNLLHHIEDVERADGEFVISAFTRPADRKLNHLEGTGQVGIKIYPQPDDIKWAADSDVYSGSVWDAPQVFSEGKKKELTSVSYSKYPDVYSMESVRPNLAEIIEELSYGHNELGIRLRGNNFRLETYPNASPATVKLVNNINSILDNRYGKAVTPKILPPPKLVSNRMVVTFSDHNTMVFYRADSLMDEKIRKYNEENGTVVINEDYIEEYEGNIIPVEPKVSSKQLKVRLNEIIEKMDFKNNFAAVETLEDGTELHYDTNYLTQGEAWGIEKKPTEEEIERRKSASRKFLPKKSRDLVKIDQAVVNRRVAKLKEVLRKYPRSLILSEVRRIRNRNNQMGDPMLSDVDWQKVPSEPVEQPKKLSKNVITRVNDLLEKMGVSVAMVKKIKVNGVEIDQNAIAYLTNRLIEITEGSEDDALPEEAMHFVVEIIEQTNPTLFNQMLNKIADYSIYQEVFNNYKDIYKNKDGTPDIRKIKKEAMAQMLAEMYVNDTTSMEDPVRVVSAKNWFERALNWIKSLFVKNQVYVDPFKQAIAETEKEDFTAEALPTDYDLGTFFQLSPRQRKQNFNVDEFVTQLLAVHHSISPPVEEKKADGTIDSYYMYNGQRVPKRVTDILKQKMKDYIPDEEDEIRRQTGTRGHADLHEIFKRYVDERGYRRATPLPQTIPSQINPRNNDAYDALEKGLVARLDSYPPETRFLSELRIYNGIDTAGTIDFMAIQKDGTIDMLDWKFTEIIGDQKSILKAKVESYQIQMGAYKDIMSETYGVPRANYRLTAMVPVQTMYRWDRMNKQKVFSKVKIGNGNFTLEKNPVLLPIATEDYDTGSKKINELIKQLNSIADKYIALNSKEENRAALKEKIGNFLAVIRQLQMQKDANNLMENTKKHINELFLERKRLEQAIKQPGVKIDELKELSARIIQNRNILLTYKEMRSFLDELVRGDEKMRKTANDIASEAKELMDSYNHNIDYVTELIAKNEGIANVTRPEKQIGFIDRAIKSFSRAQTKTAQLFYRLYQQAQQAAAFATDQALTKLSTLSDEVSAYAKSQNMSQIELYEKYLFRKQEHGGENYIRLIHRFDQNIMAEIRKALDASDKRAARTLINKYVDLEKYNEDFEIQKQRVFTTVDKNTYSGNEVEDLKQKKRIKESWLEEHDITKNTALISNNGLIFKHINKEAHSAELKTIKANPVMNKVYEALIDANTRAADKGLLPKQQIYSFVPNVRKQYIDRVVQGGDKSVLTSILNSVKVEPGSDNIYGAIDPNTKLSVMSIPKGFVYDLPESLKSKDLIKTMAIWEREINEYTWKVELEGAAQIILDTERRKEILRPNSDNKNKLEVTQKQADTDKNTEYLKNFVNYYIYNKKMTDDSTDFTVTVDMQSISQKINGKLGFDLLPKYEGEDAKMTISFTKMVQAANRWFQMKTLGFNLTTPISNLTGGLANGLIMSGKYFKPEEYRTNTLRLTSMLTGEQGKVYAAMIDYFMPLVENQENVKIASLSSNKVTELMTSEVLFILQRGSDKMVTYPMLLSILENTAVINGELVNIPEHVRKEKGYYSRFYLSKEERLQVERDVESEIIAMKEKSVAKTAKIVNGELVIDGINRGDKTVWQLRNKVQSMAKDVMGASSPEDIAQYRMSLFGQSFMMFKNWIPGMALARFSDISYNVGTDSWEYGRLRLMYKLLWENGTTALKTLRDVIQLNEKGVEYMQKVYDQKLKEFEEAGGDANEFMSEEEFLEMHHRAIKMAVKETQYWLSLLTAFIGFTIATDDGDKDEYSGARAFISRAFDKSKDELGFFFSPLSAMDIANGSVFPALGTVNDALKFMSHFGKEIGGAVFGVEDWSEDAKPTKYLFKTFPVTKEMLTVIAVFYPELADEMGIKISNNYSVR